MRIGPNGTAPKKKRDKDMPYDTVEDLPAPVKKLDPSNQHKFLTVFNSAHKQYGDESRAFAVAWAAVGGAPKKKEDDGDKEAREFRFRPQPKDRALKDPMGRVLRSFELNGGNRLMLFPRGTFKHPEYGTMQFDDGFFGDIVKNFSDRVLGHTEPFIDVDHNHGAACGWIKQLSVEPDGLFANVSWTPLGERLVSSGEYRFFSPWWGTYKDPGSSKTFDRVLRGGALTNVPFLKVLPPVELFEPGVPSAARTRAWAAPTECKLAEMLPYAPEQDDLQSRATRVRTAFNERFNPLRSSYGPSPCWICDMYDDSVIAGFEHGDGVRYFQVPYEDGPEGTTFFPDDRREVRQGWEPVNQRPPYGLTEEGLVAELKARYGPAAAVAHVLREARKARGGPLTTRTRRPA